jgi:hypothetical protein
VEKHLKRVWLKTKGEMEEVIKGHTFEKFCYKNKQRSVQTFADA